MKRLSLLLIMITLNLTGQEKFTTYFEATSLNVEQNNFTLDSRLSLGGGSSITSWNSYATGRTLEMGSNYFVSSTLLNFQINKTVLSVGHNLLVVPYYNTNRNSFVIRLRTKLF